MKTLILASVLAALLLTACGKGQANTNGSVEVEVVLGDFTIESSVTEFKPGVQYRFSIRNEGLIPHEFMIMPVAMDGMGMVAMSMEEKDALSLMVVTEEELPPGGATVELDYTFTSVPEGNIEFVCALPGHFEAGMHIPVSIK